MNIKHVCNKRLKHFNNNSKIMLAVCVYKMYKIDGTENHLHHLI